MKKLFLLLALPAVAVLFSFSTSKVITEAEKKFAVDHLNQTRTDLLNSVNGLSESQLNFKPSEESWSVLECVQHIVLTSQSIFNYQQAVAKMPNDSNFKASFPDDKFIELMEDRSHKVKTAEQFKPVHSPYKNLDETLTAFNANRDSIITYVNATNEDLRNHVAAMPFGKVDAYQMVLMISAHTNRHTQQLNEVKADPNFPKQ